MFTLAETSFKWRLFTGTGKFASAQLMLDAILASGSELVTLAMRRVDLRGGDDALLPALRQAGVRLLPNTSGAKTAEEALFAARLAREALGTHWIKLEIHPDMQYLLPDPIETLKAAEQLVKEGVVVLPYCGADPVLCRRLAEAGCAAVIPLGSPIGSNQGLKTRDFLHIIIEQVQVPVVVDAGIGAPSQALEMGADAVLANTAITVAQDPVAMARASRVALEAGELARQAGLAPHRRQASATSPLTGFLTPLGGGASMTTFTPHWQQIQWDDVGMRIHSQTARDVERALAEENPGPADMIALLSPAALPYLEPLAQRAQRLTRQRFGNTINFYGTVANSRW